MALRTRFSKNIYIAAEKNMPNENIPFPSSFNKISLKSGTIGTFHKLNLLKAVIINNL